MDHDTLCESENTSHGYTPCRCYERALFNSKVKHRLLCSACSAGMHDRINCLGTAATEDGRPVPCECDCGGA